MPKNRVMPRVDLTNDIAIVLALIMYVIGPRCQFDGRKKEGWFVGTDLLSMPFGEYLGDPSGSTLNSNANRILEHMVGAGILCDIGSKRSHGGKHPSVYTLNPANPIWDDISEAYENGEQEQFDLGNQDFVYQELHRLYNKYASWRANSKMILEHIYLEKGIKYASPKREQKNGE